MMIWRGCRAIEEMSALIIKFMTITFCASTVWSWFGGGFAGSSDNGKIDMEKEIAGKAWQPEGSTFQSDWWMRFIGSMVIFPVIAAMKGRVSGRCP